MTGAPLWDVTGAPLWGLTGAPFWDVTGAPLCVATFAPLWGVVAFIVQLATFFAVKLFLRKQGESLSQHITEGHQAYGILMASVAVAVGLLNAASMTW